MRAIGALSAALCAFLVVATLTGHGDTLALRLPRRRRSRVDRATWLRQAGVDVSPAQFWVVSVVVGVVVEVVCWAISGSAYVGLALALAATLAPKAYFARRRERHLGAVVESWPDGIRHLIASTGSHHTIHQSLEDLAVNGPPPLRVAFARYADLQRLLGVEGALLVIREELADPISDRVIEMLIVAHSLGQALVLRILRDQAEEVVADLRTSAEIRAQQHEPRLTARIAFVLPWCGLTLLCATVPTFADFYRSGGGLVAIALAGTMSSLGLLMSRRLARETPEPRVLAHGLAELRVSA